ncbi:MAG TPA: DHA2 family efflux MFS transporter permease subunit [Hyphomicrobiaceae bacterium]|nr:DHA2 family efflux MFS transporter permease subunit [Hyphomicrobiaceae bacterium]
MIDQNLKYRGPITVVAILASMIYSIDWTIAAVALPHMQGTFSATQDQIAWVMTSYIVMSAIALPTTGWLSAAIGRKRLFLVSIGGFTLLSFLCGAATSLQAEIIFRAGQGCFGAFLIPLSQALLLDTYPKEQHSKAMALWGLGVIFGPVIGPTIGGYLTDLYSWRWVFYVSVPIGILAYAGGAFFLPRDKPGGETRFDFLGFAALATSVGCFQLMLDRGERQDWLESTEIQIELGLCLLGLYIFVVHALSVPKPLVNLRLMLDRNYALGLMFAFLYGVLTLPPLILLPSFLASLQGYPVATVGLLLSPRGVGLMIAMLLLGRIGDRVDPRWVLLFGFAAIGIPSWFMSGWTIEVGAFQVVWTGVLQGLGAGAIIVPLGVVTFSTLDPNHRTEAASIWNLVRSAGSGIGISIAVFIVARMSSIARAELVEHVSAFNPAYKYLSISGILGPGTAAQLAFLSNEVTRQALLIGYIDVFYITAWASLATLPLIMLLDRPKRSIPK